MRKFIVRRPWTCSYAAVKNELKKEKYVDDPGDRRGGEAQISIQNKISRPEGRSGRLEEQRREQSVRDV